MHYDIFTKLLQFCDGWYMIVLQYPVCPSFIDRQSRTPPSSRDALLNTTIRPPSPCGHPLYLSAQTRRALIFAIETHRHRLLDVVLSIWRGLFCASYALNQHGNCPASWRVWPQVVIQVTTNM